MKGFIMTFPHIHIYACIIFIHSILFYPLSLFFFSFHIPGSFPLFEKKKPMNLHFIMYFNELLPCLFLQQLTLLSLMLPFWIPKV